jgi:organic radical activating enzyme
MKLVWFPTWNCNNYGGERCPYCPYGIDREEGRLTYQGEYTSALDEIDPEIVKAFFQKNCQAMDGWVEITGGEPLTYKALSDVLNFDIRWAITSNTSIPAAIDRLIESGAIYRCFSWTASYHPFSGREKEFAENLKKLAMARVPVHVTTVVSKETLPRLREIKQFLDGLPMVGKNFHLDAHRDFDIGLKEEAEKIIGKVEWFAGEPRKNMYCRKRSELLALSPAGELFECVTHCYTRQDPLYTITPDSDLNELEKKIEQCEDECFACSDWVKHIIP